jgi:hypothetical protein
MIDIFVELLYNSWLGWRKDMLRIRKKLMTQQICRILLSINENTCVTLSAIAQVGDVLTQDGVAQFC